MRNKKIKHIHSFTIFEVTVVLAIMSVIITIISFSYNRFNEQIKTATIIEQEINNFHLFRANLWKELYESDSIKINNEHAFSIFFKNNQILYESNDVNITRTSRENTSEFPFTFVRCFEEVNQSNEIKIHLIIRLKNEEIDFYYLTKRDLQLNLNRYFDNFDPSNLNIH